MIEKVQETWAKHFNIPLEQIRQPGLTIRTKDEGEWQYLFYVSDCHVVARVTADVADAFRQHFTDDLLREGEKFYYVDPQKFQPVMPEAPFTVRKLSAADQAAFDAFIAACPEDDADTADVSVDHEAAFGVFDGERIVAVASSFEWRGFTDLGVLSDPAYRGRGLGKVVVSAVAAHCLKADDRVVCYRHEDANIGSQKIAQGLGFVFYNVIESVKYP